MLRLLQARFPGKAAALSNCSKPRARKMEAGDDCSRSKGEQGLPGLFRCPKGKPDQPGPSTVSTTSGMPPFRTCKVGIIVMLKARQQQDWMPAHSIWAVTLR